VGASHANLLEQLIDVRGIYEQQISTLERQVSLLKTELKDAEEKVLELRMNGDRPSVICERCRETPSAVQMSTVSRLEQEKEDLETALMNLQNIVEVMRRR